VTGGPGPTVVECRDLSRSYGRGETEVVALRAVTCRVTRGQRIAVTGESGSGKSTLLHVLGGLETPSSGVVSWPGLELRGDRPAGVGVVFQAPSLLPMLDVADNVAVPLLLSDVPPARARQRALAALDLLGLADLADAAPDELSGGQGQRVALARVLAGEPALVLADEPTGQLDRRTAEHVLDVLLTTVNVLGAALVVSTHDPAVAARLDEQWSMADGRLDVPVESGLRR
jgi:putative ABC transport system ATP-binding protein